MCCAVKLCMWVGGFASGLADQVRRADFAGIADKKVGLQSQVSGSGESHYYLA